MDEPWIIGAGAWEEEVHRADSNKSPASEKRDAAMPKATTAASVAVPEILLLDTHTKCKTAMRKKTLDTTTPPLPCCPVPSPLNWCHTG